VTDTKQWEAKELLLFVSGHSGQEKSLSELKDDFALGYVPTHTYQANSAYFQVSQMAYTLSFSLQHDMGLVQKQVSNPKMTCLWGAGEKLIPACPCPPAGRGRQGGNLNLSANCKNGLNGVEAVS
jgi:hypothetical protein